MVCSAGGRRRGGQGNTARRGGDDQGLTHGCEVGIQLANDGVQNIHPQQSDLTEMDVMPRIVGRWREGRVGDDHRELFAAQGDM